MVRNRGVSLSAVVSLIRGLLDLVAQAFWLRVWGLGEVDRQDYLLFAAGLGAVAGAVLSFAQWLAMRRQVKGAGLWIPANMLAWLVGMPIIFWGMDAAFERPSLLQRVLLLAGILLLTGAVVGAIHGAFLIRLAGQNATQAVSRD